ncbi:hypothetical protein [Spirosoma oryzicola]|nr:hypothetical protein [Spirosoma oryzicola]UHG89586.1 hypothetical protein LQ777_15175 [Spirosoma oryzicola]
MSTFKTQASSLGLKVDLYGCIILTETALFKQYAAAQGNKYGNSLLSVR